MAKKTPPKKKKQKKIMYTFPKRACPRCGSFDTVSTSTQDGVQHRKCRRGVCRRRFQVKGIEA